MFYVGIDIAKRKHDIAIIDEEGDEILSGFHFSNSSAGFEKLLKMLAKLDVTPTNCRMALEATGHYWLALFTHLSEADFEICVINPICSDAFRKLSIRKVKNDTVDAIAIAQFIRFDATEPTALASEQMVALKRLSRFRGYLVQQVSDCKRKVIAALDQVFPEYEKLFGDTFGATSKAVLASCQTPDDTLGISTKKLTGIVAKASRGRLGSGAVSRLKEAATVSFGTRLAQDTFAFEIRQLIAQIGLIESQVAEVEVEIEKVLAELDSPITTITGIGTVLGATILSEIGDISRFSEPSKLVAYAGLDVSVFESGEFNATNNHMTKRGSRYLRYAILMAADRARMYDPELKAYYSKKMSEGKHHLVAVSAVARKMCNIIFAVLSENRPFEMRYPS